MRAELSCYPSAGVLLSTLALGFAVESGCCSETGPLVTISEWVLEQLGHLRLFGSDEMMFCREADMRRGLLHR